MSQEKKQARSIFLAAVEKIPAAEWEEYLRRECGDNEELRRDVEQLLEAHAQNTSFMQQPAAATTVIVDPLPGTRVGHYKLLQPLGEGGMGVVYMADQTEPVKRRVALKIIKPGMDTKQVIARFEAERQALATMDHPNIARVLDAGTSADSRPFFAMELVKGIPITRYCDDHHLSTRQRAKLFLSVCCGVQHAHQKGIIHRDLKPSNVLVAEYDQQVVPKIIDFGLAKALNQSLTERTLFTQFGQIVGTLEYMSPEQAKLNQLDIDTRSDIYALGVLLYELLTGSTPIEKERIRSSGIEEVLRVIQEEDPPTPSTRISSSATLPALASKRNTEAQRLPGLLRGDLDWIVMKAMAKERGDRYQTADALAADIQRHLEDEPIEARRPSAIGRARRFVRRNRLAVTLTALVLVATTVAAWLAVSAYVGRLKQERESWARETAMPTIKRLIADKRLVHAFRLAKEVQTVLPDDPAFGELWDSFTVTATFEIDPPGTKVFIRDWNGVDDPWLEVGRTPLVDGVLPNGNLRFRYVKEGYITREFQRQFPQFLRSDGPVSMREDWGIPKGMVFIDSVRADSWKSSRLPVYVDPLNVDLGEFLIDRYEVANREFQEYVDAGGYEKPKYWEGLKFVLDGETLSWQEAMQRFRDQTGRAGPAGWHNGRFPEGQGEYPVRGVSWFEAAAYARFAGMSLPTIYHWQWAADTDRPGNLVALSNFDGRGPAPGGRYQGIGRFDVYDLAGNVKEWCWNRDPEGRRCLQGGAWNESGFRFLIIDVASPWDRSETHGFRRVRYLEEDAPEPATLKPLRRQMWNPKTRERLPLKSLATWYKYDKNQPLNPEKLEPEHPSSGNFRHEIVRIDAAYNKERFNIHLFLPSDQRNKYETIVWVPDNAAWLSPRFAEVENPDWELISRLVETGRMVCYPIHKGTYERGNGTFPVQDPFQGRDLMLAASKDIARTVDYLHTRADFRADRLIYIGYAAGAIGGPRILATQPSFKAAVFIAGGYPPLLPRNATQEVTSPFHFTPHVKIPVLMINGLYDTAIPYESLQVPCFEDLGSKEKRHITLESGHDPPPEEIVREADKWLRQTLGRD